jgi:predicted peptidase
MTGLLVAWVLILAGCGSNPANVVNDGLPEGRGFLESTYTDARGKDRRFTVYVPGNYDASQRWPAIVFLHGLGEGGSDGVKNTTVGLGPAIAKNPERFPFIVIFPQSGGTWDDAQEHELVIAALDTVKKRYSIDDKRIVITGLSTGGLGTWLVAAKYADRFAAVAPMCAYYADDAIAPLAQSRLPIWAFHNSGDPFVGAGGTRKMVERINASGGNAKVTIYGALGHDCWNAAYNDPQFIAWLRNASR